MEGIEQRVTENAVRMIMPQEEEHNMDYIPSAEKTVNIGIVKAVADLNLSDRARRRIRDQVTDYMVEVAGDVYAASRSDDLVGLQCAVVEFIDIGRLPAYMRDAQLYRQLQKEIMPTEYRR